MDSEYSKYCPLSMASEQPKTCIPNCKFILDSGKCLLREWLNIQVQNSDRIQRP